MMKYLIFISVGSNKDAPKNYCKYDFPCYRLALCACLSSFLKLPFTWPCLSTLIRSVSFMTWLFVFVVLIKGIFSRFSWETKASRVITFPSFFNWMFNFMTFHHSFLVVIKVFHVPWYKDEIIRIQKLVSVWRFLNWNFKCTYQTGGHLFCDTHCLFSGHNSLKSLLCFRQTVS